MHAKTTSTRTGSMTAVPMPATTIFHHTRTTNAIYPYTMRLLPVPTDRTFMYNQSQWVALSKN